MKKTSEALSVLAPFLADSALTQIFLNRGKFGTGDDDGPGHGQPQKPRPAPSPVTA